MHRKLPVRLWPSILRKRRTVVVLALGFTTVPAVALAATDAVPGDPFKLGQGNSIAATTTVTGTGQGLDGVLHVRKTGGGLGPAVRIENSAPGVSQHGLIIKTRPGQSPLTVNSDAGKASFLNADKVDGRDADEFLPTRTYNVREHLVTGVGDGEPLMISLGCDAGDIALNGGGHAFDTEDHLVQMLPERNTVMVEFADNGLPSAFRANLVCLDSASPHRSQ